MTSQVDALQMVIRALEACQIPYMVVGSFAASMHGASRNTHDIDIVLALRPQAVPGLARALGDDFYVDEVSGREAVERADMFNVLHLSSDLKVDFFVLREDPFSRAEFERRVRVKAWGTEAYVASLEDTLLSKLIWNKITPSERQLDDVRGILRVRQDALDYDYLHHWAQEKGVENILNQLIEETKWQENP